MYKMSTTKVNYEMFYDIIKKYKNDKLNVIDHMIKENIIKMSTTKELCKIVDAIKKNKIYEMLYDIIKKYKNDKFNIIDHLIKEKEIEHLIKLAPIIYLNENSIIPLWDLIPDIDFFKKLKFHCSEKFTHKLLEKNIIELFKIVIKNKILYIFNLLRFCTESNNLEKLNFLLKLDLKFDIIGNRYLTQLAKNNLEILIKLNENKLLYQSEFIRIVDSKYVEYFIEHDLLDKEDPEILYYAIKCHTFKIIKSLFDKNYKFEKYKLCEFCEETLSFKLIKLLVEKGCEIDHYSICLSTYKNYKITKYLLKRCKITNLPFDSDYQYLVFQCGKMEIISNFIDMGFLEIERFKRYYSSYYIDYLEEINKKLIEK